MPSLPPAVAAAHARAETHGFAYSCEPIVGQLLATLSAAVPPAGRILELGTGVGAGLAWIAQGAGQRDDVRVISVDHDPRVSAIAAQGDWPATFDLRVGDAETLLPELGTFDLIFADAAGGKWSGFELTMAALAPGGVLVLDDMDTRRYPDAKFLAVVDTIRRTLHADAGLVTTDLPVGSGIVVATRRR